MEKTLTRFSALEAVSLTTLSGERLGISGIEMTERTLVMEVLSDSTAEECVNVDETCDASLAEDALRVWGTNQVGCFAVL
jgi:ABC-type polysaccharide/polyol phosphate transport system ATPase subunit